MNRDLCDRYAGIDRTEFVREDLFPSEIPRIPERELQARWFGGEFGTTFTGTQGQEVEIVQFGVWNHEAGPDFSDCAVRIDGGEAVRGSIELDWDARDWEFHGHAGNPEFEGVVLHVFVASGNTEFFTRTIAHRNVVQVRIDPRNAPLLKPANEADARPGLCAEALAAMPDNGKEVLEAAAMYRLHRKATRFRKLAHAHGEEEALYQQIAEAFGYKANRLPFMLLAQRLPLRRLLRAKEEIEPLLFGLSGFLSLKQPPEAAGDTRGFLRAMWENWWRLRGEQERLLLSEKDWKTAGQRPQNHPQRRVAALAQTLRNWPALRRCFHRQDAPEVRRFFTDLSDPYWDFHFTLTSAPAAKRVALVGETRIHELLVNVFYPVFAEERPELWEDYLALNAGLENRRAAIAAARLFPSEAIRKTVLKSAAHQQALMQIYEDFCVQDCSNCRACPFPDFARRQAARAG